MKSQWKCSICHGVCVHSPACLLRHTKISSVLLLYIHDIIANVFKSMDTCIWNSFAISLVHSTGAIIMAFAAYVIELKMYLQKDIYIIADIDDDYVCVCVWVYFNNTIYGHKISFSRSLCVCVRTSVLTEKCQPIVCLFLLLLLYNVLLYEI